jgi:hypothetical protein
MPYEGNRITKAEGLRREEQYQKRYEDACQQLKDCANQQFNNNIIIRSDSNNNVTNIPIINNSDNNTVSPLQPVLQLPSFRAYMFYYKHGGKHFCIDATPCRGYPARYINHSHLQPNLRPRLAINPITNDPYICLFAIKNIAAGEELTFDYGNHNGVRKDNPRFGWLKTT